MKDLTFYTKLYVKSQGKLNINNIALDNFTHDGYISGLNSSSNQNVKFNSGIIKINNKKLIFDNFDTTILKGRLKIKGHIDNFLSIKPQGDLKIDLENIDLAKFDNIIPKTNFSSSYIKNGNITFKNNDIKFNSMSMNYETMPLFFNAQIKDIYSAKNLSADFSAILNEKSTDIIINPYLTYPIKIKEEIPIKGYFKGNSDKYLIDAIATFPINSDIYYSGANLGDINHKRELQAKIEVNQNIASVHNLKLIKFITNQNNKTNPIIALKANGQAIENNGEINYNNFKISRAVD